MKLHKFIATTIREYLNEQKTFNHNYDIEIRCIQRILKQELDKYNNENYDNRWDIIRGELRSINENLYYLMTNRHI